MTEKQTRGITERNSSQITLAVAQEVSKAVVLSQVNPSGAIALLSSNPDAVRLVANLAYNRPDLTPDNLERKVLGFTQIRLRFRELISYFNNAEFAKIVNKNPLFQPRVSYERDILNKVSEAEASAVWDIEIALRLMIEDISFPQDSHIVQSSQDLYIALHDSLERRHLCLESESDSNFIALGQEIGKTIRANRILIEDLTQEPNLPHGLQDYNHRVAQLKTIAGLIVAIGQRDRNLGSRLISICEDLALGLANSYPEKAIEIRKYLRLGVAGLCDMSNHIDEPGKAEMSISEIRGWGH